MAGNRDKPEEIVVKLRQVEVLQGQGSSIVDAVRRISLQIACTDFARFLKNITISAR